MPAFKEDRALGPKLNRLAGRLHNALGITLKYAVHEFPSAARFCNVSSH